MNPLWWILIVLILLAVITLVVVILYRCFYKKDKTPSNLSLSKDLHVIGYCFVSKTCLDTMYNQQELIENKYETRPFICLSSPYLLQSNKVVVIPELTNHKDKIYPNDFYLCNNQYKLSVSRAIVVDKNYVDLNSCFSKQPQNVLNLQEIRRRENELVRMVYCCVRKQ